MVPFGVPEVILEKSDLVPLRIKRYLRPAWMPEPGVQAAVNTITQQEPLLRNTVEWLGQVKENHIGWESYETNYAVAFSPEIHR